MNGLTIGRIVHLVWTKEPGASHRPAIVLDVLNGETGRIQVCAFPQGSLPVTVHNFDPDGKKWDSWHWPERA